MWTKTAQCPPKRILSRNASARTAAWHRGISGISTDYLFLSLGSLPTSTEFTGGSCELAKRAWIDRRFLVRRRNLERQNAERALDLLARYAAGDEHDARAEVLVWPFRQLARRVKHVLDRLNYDRAAGDIHDTLDAQKVRPVHFTQKAHPKLQPVERHGVVDHHRKRTDAAMASGGMVMPSVLLVMPVVTVRAATGTLNLCRNAAEIADACCTRLRKIEQNVGIDLTLHHVAHDRHWVELM